MAESRTGIEAIKGGLVSQKIDGKEFWVTPETITAAAKDRSSVVLLPGYDEYLLGYQNRDAILDPQYATYVCPGGNGVFASMLVIDGQIAGTWKRTIKKKTVEIMRKEFTELSNSNATAFEVASQRYGAFYGLPVIFSQS